METIHEIDTIKIEKAKAMRRYKTFRKIANIFRSIELFVAILLTFICISWSSSYIPAIVQSSGEFLRRLSSFFISPHFVFVIGNIIIITLFANSSFAEKSGKNDQNLSEEISNSGEFLPENADVIVDAVVFPPAVEKKVYRRSQSASTVEVAPVVDRRELRRSVTVPRRKIRGGEIRTVAAAEARRLRNFEEDELSNEDFNRKVEEFIEKQRKFLSEETMTLVLSN